MEIALLIIGLAIGVLIGYLIGKSKFSKNENIHLQKITEQEVINQQLNSQLIELKTEITAKENQISEGYKKIKDAEISAAQKQTEIDNLKSQFTEFKEEASKMQQQLKVEFKNIANEIVKEQSKDFSEHNQSILKPFKNQLESFEKAVQEQMKDSIARASSFKEQIDQLKSLNLQISEEATNLTNALKGDNKFQGNWGELILERVLENSGLIKGSEYDLQVSLTNVDEDKIQPDAIVYLPDRKHIIIDSKVSLVAYEKYVNSTDDAERDLHLKAHLLSVKNHIKQLSEKKYQTANGISTPDFILLFVPIEASFGVAVKEDIDLFNFAWNKNIVIVSPSTLLATLKTVASLWKQEKQNKNVLKIAEESGKLYDKFVGFISDLEKIEKSLDKTASDFSEVKKKLSGGQGDIIGRIEKIKALGAKATKQIDEKYLED